MKRFWVPGALALSLLAGCTFGGPSAELKKGWELMLIPDYPAARDHYEAMLVEHPENAYAHLNLGVAYHQLGDLDRAREHYQASVQYGEKAVVSQVVEQGAVEATTTTVADKGRQNLALLTPVVK